MKSVILIWLFVSANSAYDFKDSFFNEVLAEEFRDISAFTKKGVSYDHDIKNNHQTEEQYHCKPHNTSKCCDESFNNDTILHLEETHMDCFFEVIGNFTKLRIDPFDCNQIEEVKEKIICYGQCLGQKLNIVDYKNDISRNGLLKHLKSILHTEWQLEAAESIVDRCMDEIIPKEEDSISDADNCNPQTLKVLYCLWLELAKACPLDKQIISDMCDNFRERLSSGEILSRINRFLHRSHHN